MFCLLNVVSEQSHKRRRTDSPVHLLAKTSIRVAYAGSLSLALGKWSVVALCWKKEFPRRLTFSNPSSSAAHTSSCSVLQANTEKRQSIYSSFHPMQHFTSPKKPSVIPNHTPSTHLLKRSKVPSHATNLPPSSAVPGLFMYTRYVRHHNAALSRRSRNFLRGLRRQAPNETIPSRNARAHTSSRVIVRRTRDLTIVCPRWLVLQVLGAVRLRPQ